MFNSCNFGPKTRQIKFSIRFDVYICNLFHQKDDEEKNANTSNITIANQGNTKKQPNHIKALNIFRTTTTTDPVFNRAI